MCDPGRRGGGPGGRGCAIGFAVGSAAVVVATLFGCLVGEGRSSGFLGLGLESLSCWQRSSHRVVFGDPWVTWVRVRAKAQLLCAGGGDAYGRRNPLAGVVGESSLYGRAPGENPSLFFGLGIGDALRRYPHEGGVVELRGVFAAAPTWCEASSAPAWDGLAGLLSFTRDIVASVLGPRCFGQDRRSMARSKRAGGPLQEWLGVFGVVRCSYQEAWFCSCSGV